MRSSSVSHVAEQIQALAEALAVGSPAGGVAASEAGGGIVFLSGALLAQMPSLAAKLGALRLGVPLLLVGGSGVLSERGELTEQSAATGLVWSGAKTQLRAVDSPDREHGLSEGLADLLSGASGPAASLVFVRPGAYSPAAIQRLGETELGPHLFGGGAIGDPGVVGVGADGGIVHARCVVLRMFGRGLPRIRTAYSCRLLGPLREITASRGSTVLRIAGEPALDALGRLGQGLDGQPLVFTVLSHGETESEGGQRPQLLVRGVQGIEPDERGLVVSEEVRPGMLMTFGVRDAKAAREDLQDLARQLAREMAGAAPQCALYINCSGRGEALHGRANVDTRILRERFGDIPMAGVQSSFEIAPHGSSASFQLYTGVLSLFSALS